MAQLLSAVSEFVIVMLMAKSIIIRVDSSYRIGTGHVSRCLRLAEELKHKGARVAFICADLPGNISSSISKSGFEIELLDPPVQEQDLEFIESPWPTIAQLLDAYKTSKAAVSRNAEVVVVDHYALSELWESQLSSDGFKVVALDDLPLKPHSAEIVVRPGLSLTDSGGGASHHTARELSGPRYAMVPKEFCEAKNLRETMNDSVPKRVLVYFGGVDAGNASEKVVDAIVGAQGLRYFIELVLGSGNTRSEKITRKYATSPQVTVHNSLSSLSDIIVKCHVGVGAGGVSAFERVAAGLPTILYSLSKNQIGVCNELDGLGLARYFGDFESFSSGDFVSRFSLFVQELPKFRETFELPEVIDCLGVKRIAELIHHSSQEFLLGRVARLSDLVTYFDWVNEQSVRSNSLNSARIEFQEHGKWFRESLEDPSVVMLIFELDNLPIAQVRFKLKEDHWNLNYSLDEIIRGRGWAKIIVGKAVSWLRSHRDARRIDAVVKASNLASISALTASGFVSPSDQADSDKLTLCLLEA
jgi:UDP-2,4-diacetamido-2,4,6-trideoxy-beta-L-altropyranose hydrolase